MPHKDIISHTSCEIRGKIRRDETDETAAPKLDQEPGAPASYNPVSIDAGIDNPFTIITEWIHGHI